MALVDQPKKKTSQKYVPQIEETDSDSDSTYKDIEEYQDSGDSDGFIKNGESAEFLPPQKAKRDSANGCSCAFQDYSRLEACCCCEKRLKKRPEKGTERPAESSVEKTIEKPAERPRQKRSSRPCNCCACSAESSQPLKVIMVVFRPTAEKKKSYKNTDVGAMDFACFQNSALLRNLVAENCDTDNDPKLVEFPQVSSDCFGEKLLCTCQFKDRKNSGRNGNMTNRNGKIQNRALGGAELSANSYEENSYNDYLHLPIRPILQHSPPILDDFYASKKKISLRNSCFLAQCSMCPKMSLSEDYICSPLHESIKDYYLKSRSFEKPDLPEILKSYDIQSSNILKSWFALNNYEPIEVLWTKFKSPPSCQRSILTRPSIIAKYWSDLKIDFYQKWHTMCKYMRIYKYVAGQQQQQQRIKRDICECPATIKCPPKPEPQREICDCPVIIKPPLCPKPEPMTVIKEEPVVVEDKCPPKQIEDYCADFLSIVHDNILESK
uniref:Uncharacterized protein n=1 Tax=Glossina brevipalpis TaxID=37001 RepID=A0A1A9W8B3_9MUSC